MIRIRHSKTRTAYMVDNGTKALYIDEGFINVHGGPIRSDWLSGANPVIDMISNVEVGGEYTIDEIPLNSGTVIMSTSPASTGWLVLTYNCKQWNFGPSEYTIPDSFKNYKWRVLAL